MFRNKTIEHGLAEILIGITVLALITEWASAQVVIVSRQRLAPVTVSKPKNKMKKKQRIESEQDKNQIAELAFTEFTVMPESPLPASQLSFVITPPDLKKDDARNILTRKALPELLGYEFDVINVDDKGRLGERRKERARFYIESLGGGNNLEMVEIQSGAFVMGSQLTELEQIESHYSRGLSKESRPELHTRLLWETPQSTIKVAGFYLSKFEVTQAQWRAVAALPKISRELISDPSGFKGGNRPVEQISWEDAVEFCARLSAATGRRYRLPTEAEWEYACRAGTNWQFNLGETVDPDWVNYNGKLPYAAAPKDTFRQQTVPVGSLSVANAFGLYDMHGNVWEWCLDNWRENYSEPQSNSNQAQDTVTDLRALRGGAWDSAAGECRSSGRKQAQSPIRMNNIGFRVLAEVEALPANK